MKPKVFIKIPTPTEKSTQNQPNEEARQRESGEERGVPRLRRERKRCVTGNKVRTSNGPAADIKVHYRGQITDERK